MLRQLMIAYIVDLFINLWKIKRLFDLPSTDSVFSSSVNTVELSFQFYLTYNLCQNVYLWLHLKEQIAISVAPPITLLNERNLNTAC